jgi:hypothetical protein
MQGVEKPERLWIQPEAFFVVEEKNLPVYA